MYHQHPPSQGSQPFSNGPRPPPRQPPPNQQQTRSTMQVMGFQFPRPTQLPDELESALAIRGARDMDHRQIDHINLNPHHNQGSGISQHGSFSSNPVSLLTDNQPGNQQGIDWSSYQPPAKLFAGPPPTTSHQSQHHQGPQQPQSSQIGARLPNWTPSVSESPLTQAQHTHGGSGEGQSLYTPESAGSILASFGLSNEDLEVLSHYPDDQLTPDTLPFILRDIQINKSGKPKTVAPTSSSSFSHGTHDILLPPSCSSPLAHSQSPEVPSLLTVTQTAGKVIDYGHASRTKDNGSNMETFKREPLSSEQTVKMYPALPSSSSASKADKTERRQVHLEHTEPSKHGDSDYRRDNVQRKSSHSPGKEFSPSTKSCDVDRDYRRDRTKQRPSSETRSEASSRRSLSSSCGSKPHSSSKKLPTPTMINDFSAVSPKVYPHTCSLCHILCDQEKDWVEHVNTVNHTAACRDLRNKYPDWKPNLPSRSGRYGSRALWDPKDHSPSHSISQSLSHSRSPSPHPRKHRVDSHSYGPQKRSNSPHSHPRHQLNTEHRDHFEHHHSGSHSPSHLHRVSSSSRGYWTARRDRVSAASFSGSAVKRPSNDSIKYSTDTSRDLSSSTGSYRAKHGSSQPSAKSLKAVTKPGTKTTKMSAKPPPAKKKKKIVTPPSQDSSVANRLVYLTGIPEDASEQEVTDLVGSFGKINNVILMPSSEESEKGQKASVCMVKAEDAQALATSAGLSIRERHITASVAKRPEGEQATDTNSSKPVGQGKGAAAKDTEDDANQKTSNEKGRLLITGLPESGWSECDIINLIQPFGTPSDIILATQIGKALVSVADMEVAQEIVKVHTFMPAKIKNFEVKLIFLKQHISLNTPVTLYNLLMGSVDPLENRAPVGWNSLLVISNVPNTTYGSSEVQKLVRRFGTVIRTLVLSNMVICEMATAAMALSVYKRFQTFPCIIQSNPLFFSRKPDPKTNAQTRIITAYHDSCEDTHESGKGNQTAAADRENSESPVERLEKDHDDKVKTRKETAEDEILDEKGFKEDNMEKDKLTVCDTLSPLENKLEEDTMETSVDTVIKKTEETKAGASGAGHSQIPTGEESKPPSLDGTAVPKEMTMTQLPKVTQAMVNALLVECRTRTASHSNNRAAPSSEEEGNDRQTETELGQKAAAETKELTKKHTEEEGEVKRQEKKEKEARKEKEVRERDRRERERRAWEKEERAKRGREWIEKSRRERRGEERREWERRERERRERKRAHGDTSSGSRSSFRSEGSRHSYRRDEQHSVEAETKMDEELNEFPFDMSDFVTVDEVGDVADLSIKSSEGGESLPTSIQQDTPQSAPMEITASLEKPDELTSECEYVTEMMDVTTNLVLSAAVSPSPTSQADPASSRKHVPTSKPEPDITPQPETSLTAESTPEDKSIPVPVPASSLAATVVTAERSQDKNEENPLKLGQSVEEKVGPLKQEEQRKVHDEENKERHDTAAETGKQEDFENTTNAEEKTKSTMETSRNREHSLPPFDPSNPVGMEFLVPKTGFFCKVCSRFFSGSKEAEISHCKTRKHYENLQKYLKTSKTITVTTKPDSS